MGLRSIPEEATACRAAWADIPPGAFGWHIHHHILAEPLVESAEDRIAYILSGKPEAERALRLRLMRPVRDTVALASAQEAYDAALASAQEAYYAAVAPAREAYYTAVASTQEAYYAAVAPTHVRECPGCPWNGATILGGAR